MFHVFAINLNSVLFLFTCPQFPPCERSPLCVPRWTKNLCMFPRFSECRRKIRFACCIANTENTYIQTEIHFPLKSKTWRKNKLEKERQKGRSRRTETLKLIFTQFCHSNTSSQTQRIVKQPTHLDFMCLWWVNLRWRVEMKRIS